MKWFSKPSLWSVTKLSREIYYERTQSRREVFLVKVGKYVAAYVLSRSVKILRTWMRLMKI